MSCKIAKQVWGYNAVDILEFPIVHSGLRFKENLCFPSYMLPNKKYILRMVFSLLTKYGRNVLSISVNTTLPFDYDYYYIIL